MDSGPDNANAFIPAFPTTQGDHGMSLRDYFAGKALAGFMAIPDERGCPHDKKADRDKWLEEVMLGDARYLYKLADAMLKARAE